MYKNALEQGGVSHTNIRWVWPFYLEL